MRETTIYLPEEATIALAHLAQQTGRSQADLICAAVEEFLIRNFQQNESALSLDQRRALLKLPLQERRQLLAKQSEQMLSHYQQDTQWREWQVGDIIEY